MKKLLSKWLLAALAVTAAFAPRVQAGVLSSFYRVDLRTDDFLIFALCLLGLRFFFRLEETSVSVFTEKCFLLFLIACEISVFNGIFYRTVDKPLVSLLYILKWFEYFAVFALASRFAFEIKDTGFFARVFFVSGAAIVAYGIWEHFFSFAKAVYPNYYRIFERPPFHGDANHIGGFLVLWIGFFTGIYLRAKSRLLSAALLAALLAAFLPLVWTYSRKSYFALAVVMGAALLAPGSRRKAVVLASLMVLMGTQLPLRLVERLTDLGETFSSSDPFHSSWAAGVFMWKVCLWNFQSFMAFGSGLGSRHRLFYESQYLLVLAETGFAGLMAFLAMCFAPVAEIFRSKVGLQFSLKDGIVLGWLLGFAGLMVHDLSCVSLTVSKIAIPFWFLTAIVLAHVRSSSLNPGVASHGSR